MATQDAFTETGKAGVTELVVPLLAEHLTVDKRQMVTGAVRVHLQTHSRDHFVDETLARERVEVERVAVGRPVDTIPDVREEGDTTIIPVVEEILVVEKRLVLKEEIRLRRVRTNEPHRETVSLREQGATVERTGPELTGLKATDPGETDLEKTELLPPSSDR